MIALTSSEISTFTICFTDMPCLISSCFGRSSLIVKINTKLEKDYNTLRVGACEHFTTWQRLVFHGCREVKTPKKNRNSDELAE